MSGSRARAELIGDRGEAAVCEEFFRSRPFLDAEGVTHTLRIEVAAAAGEPAELLAPLVVRSIGDGPERDAISPYGYPGLTPPRRVAGLSRHPEQSGNSAGGLEALEPAEIDWGETGLVSVFLRHRLGESPLSGTTERNVVQIADPALPPKSRPSDRRQVRRNLEAGYEVQLVPGTETGAEQRTAFLDLYEQTMRRTGAAPHYFFGAAYFDRILEADRTWLALALAPGGDPAAASIAAVSDGYLHYYLSGSADSHLRDSPMKNIVARLVEHSTELGLPLNLGGGIARGDALEEFKRGFANRQIPWHTSELICDPEKYNLLSAGHAPGAFFPAYRS
ncbi:MAG: GNAT family N-acetyltransferase [Solirubrobacterales bacterium]